MVVAMGVREELLQAAEVGGPHGTVPPHEREPFPTDVLPEVPRQFVHEVAEALGVAPECVATHVIATCAAAIGNTCRVRVNDNWQEPPIIWAVTLMESGSMKTPAYNAAVEPLHLAQRAAESRYRQELSDYKKAKAEYDALTRAWSAPGTTAEAPGAIAEPVEPRHVDYYTGNSTVEALAILSERNPRGLAFTTDELAGFFTSFGAYKGGRGGDEAQYLQMYSAGPIKLDRANGKHICVPQAALSIFGTCQPAVFRKLLRADGRGHNQIENGMASRFLIAAPAQKPKRWRQLKAVDKAPYTKMIGSLLSIPMPLGEDGNGVPVVIPMSPEAEKRFGEFYNEHNDQTAAIENAPTRYHYAKLEAMPARLALIFCLCDAVTEPTGGPPVVQERHVQAGIALTRWYGREAWRFYEGDETQAQREEREQQEREKQEQQELRKLLDAIHESGGSISPREMRDLDIRWRDPLAAEKKLKALARAGHGQLVDQPPGPQGGRPCRRFWHKERMNSPEPPENLQNHGGSGETM
jgi:hypothetical protein